MKTLLKITSILLLLNNLSFAFDKEFYCLDEYFKKYQNEEKKSFKMKKIINNKIEKLFYKNTKTVKIVMVYPGNQISDYWRRSKVAFEKRMKELNISYELKDYFTKPGSQINLQAKQIFTALKENTDYLIFTLDANKHSKFIENVIHKKKPKIILQNITTPLKKWENKQPFLYVGFDHKEGSELLAQYYINKTNGIGTYAVLYGNKGYVSKMRGHKFIKYLKKNSKLRLVHEYYTFVDKNKAKTATLDLIKRSPNIKFIYATTTDIAMGAIEALREKNLIGKILVNGWGGGSSEVSAIKKSLLDVTVMRMNDETSIVMAEAIKMDLLEKTQEIPNVFSGTFRLIDKNIDLKLLESYEKEAFRYSNE